MRIDIKRMSYKELSALYSILKYAEVLIVHERKNMESLPENYRRILHSIGVDNVLSLDKLVHKIHVELRKRNPRGFLLKARGDAEYIEYMMQSMRVPIIESRGDGIGEPAYFSLDYADMYVKLSRSMREAEILVNTDIPVDPEYFVKEYMPGLIQDYFSEDIEVALVDTENKTIVLRVKDYAYWSLDAVLYYYVSDSIHGIEKIDAAGTIITYKIMLNSTADPDEFLEELREAYNVYEATASSLPEDISTMLAHDIYEAVKVDAMLGRYAGKLAELGIARMTYRRGDEVIIHRHEDSIDIHVNYKIIIKSNYPVYPVVAGLGYLLSHNPYLKEKDKLLEEVDHIIETLKKITGAKEKQSQRKPVYINT